MTALVFLRHTRVKVEKGTCYGQANVPLADSYSSELSVIRKQLNQLANLNITAMYTSPLTRCYQLASDLKAVVHLDPIQIPALMELNFGEWELKHWDHIQDPLLNVWYEHYLSQPATGGESWVDLCHRVETTCRQLIKKHSNETILMVTHAGVIRAAQVLFQGMSPQAAFSQQIPYGSIQKMTVDLTV